MALIIPNDALLGISIQQGAGASEYLKLAAGYENPVTVDGDFSYFPFTDLAMAPVKNVDSLPPEIGGKALPTGQFVTGAWAEGPVSLVPRLDDAFGWLLLAAHGCVSTISDIKIEDLPMVGGASVETTGVYTHVFTVQLDNQFFIPWITMRRLLPHTTAEEIVGEVFQDGRVASLTLAAASGRPVTADLAAMARVKQGNYAFEINPGWTATYTNFEDFGVTSCDGSVEVNNTAFDVTAVAFNLVNNLLPPAQSIVIGTVHPKDFPNLGRVLTVTVTFLVDDYDMYLSTFTGTTVDASASPGENVGCEVYKADVDVMLASQTAIGASGDVDEPYRLRFISNLSQDNVSWMVQPIRVTPNQPMVAQLTGTFLASESEYPWYLFLQNAKAGYYTR